MRGVPSRLKQHFMSVFVQPKATSFTPARSGPHRFTRQEGDGMGRLRGGRGHGAPVAANGTQNKVMKGIKLILCEDSKIDTLRKEVYIYHSRGSSSHPRADLIDHTNSPKDE